MTGLNIAIDGPAGAGKSTVAKAVAKELGILCLDTGAMYRALGLKAVRGGISPGDGAAVTPMLEGTAIDVRLEDGAQRTLLDGEDVSALIRTEQISRAASDISALRPVREMMTALQRDIAGRCDVVMEGRDIGTNVIPETKHKFYITASSEERAKRRLRELKAAGTDGGRTLGELQREIETRDRNDSSREFAPLSLAPDATLIDTTDMTVNEAVEAVVRRVREG